MCHHLFVGVAVAVEVADQGIYRGQPLLGKHRIGTVSLAHVVEPLAHRLVVGARGKHRSQKKYRYDVYDVFHVCKVTQLFGKSKGC